MSVQSAFSSHAGEIANVLESNAELAEAVAPAHRRPARDASRARVLRVERGVWDARADAEEVRGGHGLLVLSGVLIRRVGITDHVGAELLGPGDLLRPLVHDGTQPTLPFQSAWRARQVLPPAILKHRWSTRMCHYPEVAIALTA